MAENDKWQISSCQIEKKLQDPKRFFMSVLDEMRPFLTPNPNFPNHWALSAEKPLVLTLYYLKDMGSLNMAAN